MIAYLSGKIVDVSPESVILNVGGVGYELFCTGDALAFLQTGPKDAGLWVYSHVREDALTLFGFLSKVERHFFLSLIKINGVGPKMALHILSGASLTKIVQLIEAEDVKGLSQLPKVGKKTAEQIILSLKGKLVLDSEKEIPVKKGPRQEISSALVNLGFRAAEVEKAVDQLPQELDVEEGVRKGLSILSQL